MQEGLDYKILQNVKMSYFYEHRKGWETRLRTLKSYILQPSLPD